MTKSNMTSIYGDLYFSEINNNSVVVNGRSYSIPKYVDNHSITINNGKLYVGGYEVTPNGEFIPSHSSKHNTSSNSISINSSYSSQNSLDDIDDILSSLDEVIDEVNNEVIDELDILLAGIF